MTVSVFTSKSASFDVNTEPRTHAWLDSNAEGSLDTCIAGQQCRRLPQAVTANPKAGEMEHTGRTAARFQSRRSQGGSRQQPWATPAFSPKPAVRTHWRGLLCHDRDHHESKASTDGDSQAAQRLTERAEEGI